VLRNGDFPGAARPGPDWDCPTRSQHGVDGQPQGKPGAGEAKPVNLRGDPEARANFLADENAVNILIYITWMTEEKKDGASKAGLLYLQLILLFNT
jgi:hypothetical protein